MRSIGKRVKTSERALKKGDPRKRRRVAGNNEKNNKSQRNKTKNDTASLETAAARHRVIKAIRAHYD